MRAGYYTNLTNLVKAEDINRRSYSHRGSDFFHNGMRQSESDATARDRLEAALGFTIC